MEQKQEARSQKPEFRSQKAPPLSRLSRVVESGSENSECNLGLQWPSAGSLPSPALSTPMCQPKLLAPGSLLLATVSPRFRDGQDTVPPLVLQHLLGPAGPEEFDRIDDSGIPQAKMNPRVAGRIVAHGSGGVIELNSL